MAGSGEQPADAVDRTAALRAGRAQAVVEATRGAWQAYEEWALGSDELRPVNHSRSNSLGGLGCTVVESLSTLWMLGLREEFAR